MDVDLLTGAGARWQDLALSVRRLWPHFMRVRTLMVGCAGGPGALDGEDKETRRQCARQLLDAALREARRTGARQVVLKEFPVQDRDALRCFLRRGFVRIPSLPMSSVTLDEASFDEHARRRLGRATRKNLRRKFKAAARAPAINLTVLADVTEIVDELYPLYLQVYDRSCLRFEKLTKEFIAELGRRMPDRARFFVWRQKGRVIAFSICLVAGDAIYDEYIGLDYSVALDLHLYHLSYRDVVSWAIANGYKRYVSMGVSYRPKLHLRHRLEPLDLYVRRCSPFGNAMLSLLLPLISPVSRDKVLPRFANYCELWASSPD
jgi:predicted N-acyltransferase